MTASGKKEHPHFNLVTGMAIGAVLGYAAHCAVPEKSQVMAKAIGKAIGVSPARMSGFEPALAGLTVAAAAGGIGGLYGALDRTVNDGY